MAVNNDVDYYEVLGLCRNDSEKQVVKAYRKRALLCHPDKHPDNPKAAEQFRLISKALEVLSDPKKRSELDARLKAKDAAAVRRKEMDAERLFYKEKLEAAEKKAKLEKMDQKKADLRKFEVQRIREENEQWSKQAEERQRARLKSFESNRTSGSSSLEPNSSASLPGGMSFDDFEAMVLERCRQASEKSS